MAVQKLLQGCHILVYFTFNFAELVIFLPLGRALPCLPENETFVYMNNMKVQFENQHPLILPK